MAQLLELFAPFFAYLIRLAAHIGTELLPVVEEDIKNLTATAFTIVAAILTGQLTTQEGKDSFAILLDTLKTQGDTLLGKLAVEEMKLPAEIMSGLTGVLTGLPGKLLSLIS